jgi:ABC-type polysaccharide/polyol phosphate export permease
LIGLGRAPASPLATLLAERELLASLVLRDLRGRYAGSAAGLAWAAANPVVQLAILTTVFSWVLQVRLGAAAAPFPVALAWGFFPWLALQDGTLRGTTALVDGGVLVKRLALPAEVLIAQPVLAAVVQELIALVALVAVMPFLGVPLGAGVLLCVIPLALQVALTLGLGWILGVLHVYFRDTAQVAVAALQAWFYLTPIVYPLEIAPRALQGLLALNPFSGIVQAFRAFALGGEVPWGLLSWSALCALAALATGSIAIGRARRDVPDLG